MSSSRYLGYRKYKDRFDGELPWVRPEELALVPFTGKVVLINGAFDLLHAGHMRLIFAARAQGTHLICALDTDEKIRAEKGAPRPYLRFAERAAALNFMPIDLLVPVDSKKDMDQIMEVVDLRVQSEEYSLRESRYPEVPKLFVRDGKLHTSDIATRIKKGTPRNAR